MMYSFILYRQCMSIWNWVTKIKILRHTSSLSLCQSSVDPSGPEHGVLWCLAKIHWQQNDWACNAEMNIKWVKKKSDFSDPTTAFRIFNKLFRFFFSDKTKKSCHQKFDLLARILICRQGNHINNIMIKYNVKQLQKKKKKLPNVISLTT